MRLAHVRERNAAAGRRGDWPRRSIRGHDLARPRGRPSPGRRGRTDLAHDSVAAPPAGHDARRPSRPRPARRGAADLVDGFAARGDEDDARPRRRRPRARAADPPPAVVPRLLRLRAPRPDDVGAPRAGDPRGLVPAADLLLLERLGAARAGRARAGRRAAPWSSTTSSRSGRSSTRPARDLPRSVARRRSAATSSSTTGRRGTSSATRRRSGSGRRRARTSRCPSGPWLVTPDELADRRARRRDRARPRHDGDRPDARRGVGRDDRAGTLVERPLRLRRDDRPRLGGRPAAARAT